MAPNKAEVAEVLRHTADTSAGDALRQVRPVPSGSILEAKGLVKTYRRPRGSEQRRPQASARRDCRTPRPQRGGEDDYLLYDSRAHRARCWSHTTRRTRYHRNADVPEGAARYRLSVAGAVSLPQAVCRGQHSGNTRDPSTEQSRTPAPPRRSCSTSWVSRGCARARRTRFPAESEGGSKSPALWSPIRSS